MPNVMAALPNIGGAVCSTPQSLADAHYIQSIRSLRDPTFSRFIRTPTCDRQSDRHTTTAYTALAWRRAIKTKLTSVHISHPAESRRLSRPVVHLSRGAVAGARFGPVRSFCCASTRSTRAVVSTSFSSTTPTRSAATRRSASRRAAFCGSCIRRGRCAEAPRSTTRPPTSPSSPTPRRSPPRSSELSTAPATSAISVRVDTLHYITLQAI